MVRTQPITGKAKKAKLQAARKGKQENQRAADEAVERELVRAEQAAAASNGLPSPPLTTPIAAVVLEHPSPAKISKYHGRKVGKSEMAPGAEEAKERKEGARSLESRFHRIDEAVIARNKVLSYEEALQRPIPPELVSFSPPPSAESINLSCPSRPKWNYNMSKLSLEKNEEGFFTKWRAETDQKLEKWRAEEEARLGGEEPVTLPLYERNLQVYRQLWRVTEISDLLLVL